MNYRKLFGTLFAVPAAAGLLMVTGCEEEAEVETPDGEVEVEGTDAGAAVTPLERGLDEGIGEAEAGLAGMREEGERAIGDAGQQLSAPVRDRLSQLTEQLQEQAEAAKDQVEATVDTDAAGTGNAQSQALGRVNEIADQLQAAIDDGNLGQAGRYLQQLQGMKAQLPPNIQQMIDQIAQSMPGASTLLNGGATGGTMGGATGGTVAPTTMPSDQ